MAVNFNQVRETVLLKLSDGWLSPGQSSITARATVKALERSDRDGKPPYASPADLISLLQSLQAAPYKDLSDKQHFRVISSGLYQRIQGSLLPDELCNKLVSQRIVSPSQHNITSKAAVLTAVTQFVRDSQENDRVEVEPSFAFTIDTPSTLPPPPRENFFKQVRHFFGGRDNHV